MALLPEVNKTPSPEPVVFDRDGEVRTSSRDVAALFGKRHDNVLRDIAALIESGELSVGGHLIFEETPYLEPTTGQTYRQYEMSRDGFTLLAMGFTGRKALKFKMAYIAAFNAMEAELRSRTSPGLPDLSNPDVLLALVSDYAKDKKLLQSQVAVLTPKADALDMISASDGSVTITQASKLLNMKRADLTRWLDANRWVYRQNGSWTAYRDRIQSGHLEYKEANYTDQNTGMACRKPYCHITPKGLAKLATIFSASIPLAA